MGTPAPSAPPTVAADILNAITKEVSAQTAPAGWGAPSTWLFAIGAILTGSDVASAASGAGLSQAAVVGLASLGGLFIAIGGVMSQHGH